MYPESLKNLVDSLQMFSGIGEKTAERMAFSILNFEEEQIQTLKQSIEDIQKNIHSCPICNSLTDQEICPVCHDPNRDSTTLCVVEDPKNVFLFEKLGTYNGKYHVLSGLISPLDDINPEDIKLEKLIERITKDNVKEVILAFKPSVEGEITALYIKKVLEGLNVIVSRLASGVPMGADMEYIDNLTLERALEERRKIS